MSHNALKIGTAGPNAAGVITPALTDLSDVDLTGALDTEALVYDAGAGKWVPSAVSAALSYAFVGEGAANDYANTALTMAVGQPVAFYDTSPDNTIGATFTGTANNAAGWIKSVTLPAGTYSLLSVLNVVFSTTGYCATAWYNTTNSTYVSCAGVTGASQISYGPAQSSMVGTFTLTTSSVLECRIVAVSGVSSTQGTTISTYQSLLIRRIA
jgi:hypothetical protein